MVEVFADIWCPFAYVSLRRVLAARADGRFDEPVIVRAWPLELVNGKPLDPAVVTEEIIELRRSVDAGAFLGFDREAFPKTTLAALRLSSAAYAAGPDVGERVAMELRERLFERGEDISDETVLSAVADAHGIDADGGVRPQEEWDEGKRRGVQGSPHYFTDGGGFFCPSMDIKKVDGHVRVSPDAEGFDRFLASIDS